MAAVHRYTKALRKQIIEDYAARHGGEWDPSGFLQEVEAAGATHPAYGWFEWDDATAASAYRLQQAREFASKVTISFRVVNTTLPPQRLEVARVVEAPLVLSPLDGRANGGGYILNRPSEESHRTELARQALVDFEAWRRRYEAPIALAAAEGLCDALAASLTSVARPQSEVA